MNKLECVVCRQARRGHFATRYVATDGRVMWNALRKKVNKSSRSYQLSAGESDDSDGGAAAVSGSVVLKRYAKIPSHLEGLTDMADPVAVGVPPRYENPYDDARAATEPVNPPVGSDDARTSLTVDNARHLLLRGDAPRDVTDLRNNNHTDDDVTKLDDVIATDGNPDGNANHFGATSAAVVGRVSPPRLRRREKTTSVVERGRSAGQSVTDDVIDTSSPPGTCAPNATADDDESGYSTLRDIMGQVERAMLEQQHHHQLHLQTLSVAENHEDSDLDTSGDCRDIDLEQAGRLGPADWMSSDGLPAQPQLNVDEADRSSLFDTNRNRAELSTHESTVQQTANYDVPRSTPVRDRDDDGRCRLPGPRPPAPPTNDDNLDDASSTPLDGTPRSQASCSTLNSQKSGVVFDVELIEVRRCVRR